MGHYVMSPDDRPVKVSDGAPPEQQPAVPDDVAAEPQGQQHWCRFCAPPRPFTSEHAYKTHLGRTHPLEKSRMDYQRAMSRSG